MIAGHLPLTEPDISRELIDSIEWRFQERSSGARCRGEKILRRLYKDLTSVGS